jgi:hypothetical protein
MNSKIKDRRKSKWNNVFYGKDEKGRRGLNTENLWLKSVGWQRRHSPLPLLPSLVSAFPFVKFSVEYFLKFFGRTSAQVSLIFPMVSTASITFRLLPPGVEVLKL